MARLVIDFVLNVRDRGLLVFLGRGDQLRLPGVGAARPAHDPEARLRGEALHELDRFVADDLEILLLAVPNEFARILRVARAGEHRIRDIDHDHDARADVADAEEVDLGAVAAAAAASRRAATRAESGARASLRSSWCAARFPGF